MKRKSYLIIIIVSLITLGFAHPPYHTVKHVIDGDTILLETGEHVRYLGMDAPEFGHDGEPNEFMAVESSQFNRASVSKRGVRLEFDQERIDHHGRLLAYVFLEDGDMVNVLLVRKGLARVLVVKPNLKYFQILLDSQRMAMSEKTGLWSKTTERPEPFYIGNKKSYRFHRPGCPFAKEIAPTNLIKFSDSFKAYREGFNRCRRCKP
jgi:endonuclease YncB( thermonuclease family)